MLVDREATGSSQDELLPNKCLGSDGGARVQVDHSVYVEKDFGRAVRNRNVVPVLVQKARGGRVELEIFLEKKELDCAKVPDRKLEVVGRLEDCAAAACKGL